jgi:hypothetical protein
MFHDFKLDNVNPKTIRHQTQLGQLVLLLNKMNRDENATFAPGAAVDEAYGASVCITRLLNNRALLICAIQSKFPKFQYANLATLAATICFIFLTETYSTTQQQQEALDSLDVADNQLAFAWSILIGTSSMLFVCAKI